MFGWSKKKQCPALTDRELLYAILLEMKAMALDLTKLNAASARLVAAVDALIAAQSDPAVQTAVDGVAGALDAEAVKAEAAVAPPVVPAP